MSGVTDLAIVYLRLVPPLNWQKLRQLAYRKAQSVRTAPLASCVCVSCRAVLSRLEADCFLPLKGAYGLLVAGTSGCQTQELLLPLELTAVDNKVR